MKEKPIITKTSTPYAVVFYPGGRRPHALRCTIRDYANGLIADVALVDRGAVWIRRSQVATRFLATKHEWMIMLDGDLAWREDLIPILGVLCTSHRGIVGSVVSKDEIGQGLATSMPPGRHDGIGGGGLGSTRTDEAIGSPMAIHRDALEKMIDELGHIGPSHAAITQLSICKCSDERNVWWSFFHPKFKWSDHRGAFIEQLDDSSFCDRARAAGVDLRVAYGPEVYHWGEYPYSYKDGLSDVEQPT